MHGSKQGRRGHWSGWTGIALTGVAAGLLGAVVLWGQQPEPVKSKPKGVKTSPIPDVGPKEPRPLGVVKTAPGKGGTTPPKDPKNPKAETAPVEKGAEKGPAKGETPAKGTAKKYDPLFEGWEKPAAVLVLTGQQIGYIEPCGCTGLANQKGGLARRHTLLKQLADEKGWPVVPLDVGSQVERFGRQSEIKFQRTAEALRTLGYQAVALGAGDLKMTASELLAGTNSNDGTSIFISSNVALLARDLTPQVKVIEAGGVKIGVTAVLADDYVAKLTDSDLISEPAERGMAEAIKQLTAADCTINVLLAHASIEESQRLAKKFPGFDIVVTSGGFGEPLRELEKIEGTNTLLAQVGKKGMFASVVGIYPGPKDMPAKGKFRYQRVPLDDRFADSPDMMKLLSEYQQQLKGEGLEGLGIRPQPHPTQHKFVGSDACAKCHQDAFDVWKDSPHGHATDSIVSPPNQRSNIARHFDPECLSCHVTGWEPQKFYPFESGYLSLEKTPLLKHSGCENCHGPGSEHVAAEEPDSKVAMLARDKLRQQMRLPIEGNVAQRRCTECHDTDNSPDFKFDEYWEQIKH